MGRSRAIRRRNANGACAVCDRNPGTLVAQFKRDEAIVKRRALAIRHDDRLRRDVVERLAEVMDQRQDGAPSKASARDLSDAARFVAEQFVRYIDVRTRWDPSFESYPHWVDVRHSALLSWLLQGREPTPLPPPILYSYPCHRLAAGEPIKIDVQDLDSASENGSLVIGQNADDFRWHDRGDGLIMHIPTSHIYRLNGSTLQRLTCGVQVGVS